MLFLDIQRDMTEHGARARDLISSDKLRVGTNRAIAPVRKHEGDHRELASVPRVRSRADSRGRMGWRDKGV